MIKAHRSLLQSHGFAREYGSSSVFILFGAIFINTRENMFFKKLAAIAAVTLVSTAAFAQSANDGVYAEVAYTASTYKVDNLSGSWTPSALRGVVGKGLSENLAVEGMLLFGMSDSTNLGVNLKLTSGAGFYLKPRVKLGESVEVFARLGWANINSKVGSTITSSSTNTSDNGTSYGLGGSYSFNKTTSLNLDYMMYNDSNGAKIDGISVGVGFKF